MFYQHDAVSNDLYLQMALYGMYGMRQASKPI
jgi:hypothetical protein